MLEINGRSLSRAKHETNHSTEKINKSKQTLALKNTQHIYTYCEKAQRQAKNT
jgi:hypothetical protein